MQMLIVRRNADCVRWRGVGNRRVDIDQLCLCVFGEGSGTHSTALAWKLPWAEEPGGLQSMGSLRVRQTE